MSFINTVDILGDEALSNSIIDRSIVEISDGNITKVGPRAFMRCGALKRADFLNVNIIEDRAFSNAAQLETLILREDSVSLLNGVNHFNETKIVSGTGYIYVPAALVDSYKAASGWSTYASQIRAIEDYPEVCDPYSWEAVATNIENGTYKDVYKIGDTVPVDLGSEGIVNMQIAAFDTDTLADGSGTAAITWVAKELLTSSRTDQMSAAWSTSNIRKHMQETVAPLIPESVTNVLVSVQKKHSRQMSDGDTNQGMMEAETTEDTVWIPSAAEVGVIESTYNYASNYKNYGTAYALFSGANSSRVKAKNSGGSAVAWRVRDVCAYNPKYVMVVTVAGEFSYNVGPGVCLGFCTGRTPTA